MSDENLIPINCTVSKGTFRRPDHYDARTDPNRLVFVSVFGRRKMGAQKELESILKKLGYKPVWVSPEDLEIRDYRDKDKENN